MCLTHAEEVTTATPDSGSTATLTSLLSQVWVCSAAALVGAHCV